MSPNLIFMTEKSTMSNETGNSYYRFCLNQSKDRFNLIKTENKRFIFLKPYPYINNEREKPKLKSIFPNINQLVCVNG